MHLLICYVERCYVRLLICYEERSCVHLLISDVEVGPDFVDISVLRASFPEESLQFKCTWGAVTLVRVDLDCSVGIFLRGIQTC